MCVSTDISKYSFLQNIIYLIGIRWNTGIFLGKRTGVAVNDTEQIELKKMH
jgi:hypothetical protein